MPLPDDTPYLARLARWSDWWFTPRWRALLTWLACAGLGAAIYHSVGMDRLFEMRVWLRNLGSRFIPVALPWSFLMAVTDMNFGLLATWFEPLALRLNPWRSALWLALRVAPSFAVNLLPSMNVTSRMLVLILLPALLEVPVLWRRRSHPWMPVVGAASSTFISFQFSLTPYWLSVQAFSLCYAIPLLYGTRLLTPKERERALLAREPAQ